MTDVYISLLKGSNNSKLNLLKENFPIEKILSLGNLGELEKKYSLGNTHNSLDYQNIINEMERQNIGFINLDSINYPGYLREIYDPPFGLFYRGALSSLKNNLVSVVGTRKPTLQGYHGAFLTGLDLGKTGVGVVSGLALGIDGAAHLGNIAGKGKTVAVLGCGIDMIYPKENIEIASNIIMSGGCIISEFPPLAGIKPYYFPKRNRIIAGLTTNTIIVQGPLGSGSIITSDFALENGRNVWVHSSGCNDKKFLGTQKLVNEGATVIERVFPVLKELNLEYSEDVFWEEDYSNKQLLSMELNGQITKYRGGYFKL